MTPAAAGRRSATRCAWRNRVGWRQLWRAMRAKNACKTCALGMGGQRGGMVNEAGPLARGLQEIAAGDGRRHAGRHPAASSSQHYSHRPAADAVAARAGMVRPADRRRCYAGPGDTHYRAIGWDEALDRIADQAASARARRDFFYASGRSSNEAGFLLQLFARLYGTNYVNNCSLLLPPGQRRRPGAGRSAPAPRRSRSTMSRTPTCSS